MCGEEKCGFARPDPDGDPDGDGVSRPDPDGVSFFSPMVSSLKLDGVECGRFIAAKI